MSAAGSSGRSGLNDTASGHSPRSGYITIVGRPNVGKSTLLNHLVGQKVSITSRKAQTTRHRIAGILTQENAQFVFLDTPGFQTRHVNALNRTMNRVVSSSLRDASVVLFVVEAGRFDDRDREILKLLPQGRPVVLVINKVDNATDKSALLPFIHEISGLREFSAIVPVSAKHGTHLEVLLEAIRPLLPMHEMLYPEDEVTDRNERFLAAEFLREKIFRLTGDEIPYSTSVTIEQFSMDGDLRRIHAAILVDRDAHKAMLIGKGGLKLKEIATQARMDMEKLFGGKVHLEVWVKVRTGWADDPRALKSLGYE